MSGIPQEMRQRLIELLPRLRRFARSLVRHDADADDVVQIALERALLRFEQWQQDTRLDSWMYAIIRNAWLDEVRARQRRGVQLDVDEVREVISAPGENSATEMEAVQHAMAQLPEEQRTAVSLVLIEGLSYKEAAATMQIPIGTLTSRLARGREALQKLLGGPAQVAS
jgi:RNA polymerase sigma-70 factor (ECF subfamily)